MLHRVKMSGKNLKISILSYFIIAVILDGLQRISGLFILELLQSVNTRRQNAALPFTVSWAVSNIVASLSRILIPSKKSECFILFGILLAAMGTGLCILTVDSTLLVIFWGLIFGSGHGLSSPFLSRYLKTTDSVKLLSFFRTTPSLGTAIMPFVFHILTTYYGLQGCYLMFSGIIINCVPLFVAASYNVEFAIPNIKWRVRKRSEQYFVSKQDGSKIVSNESFINSLEPDLILTVSQSKGYQAEVNNDHDGTEVLMKEVIHAFRKRSETRGNDLKGLPDDINILLPNTTHPQMFAEIQNYENGRRVFEGSFSNKDIIDEDKEVDEKSNCDRCENCNIIHKEKELENVESSMRGNDTIDARHNIYLTQQILQESNKREITIENKESERIYSHEGRLESFKTVVQSDIFLKNETSQSADGCQNIPEKDCRNKKLSEENYKENSSNKKFSVNLSPHLPDLKAVNSSSENDSNMISRNNENKTVINIPLDIKVHVVECFMTDEEYWCENRKNAHAKSMNNYKNHSNFMPPELKNNDFTAVNFSSNTAKCSELHKSKLSSVYTITEDTKFDGKSKVSLKRNQKPKNGDYTMSKIKSILRFLNKITTPACICIMLLNIIFELNIVTLIAISADFGRDIENDCLNFKYILVSFGVGGLVGKFCCCKISRTIPEKSHTVGVILFLLAGLSTAGVLFSSNLYWLAGFYCILGALEGGITYAIPKFILEHIDKNLHSQLSSATNFLSGLAVVCIPYVIGLSRDELGDYEFLLQILSCSSVLCAFLAYFLPHLSRTS